MYDKAAPLSSLGRVMERPAAPDPAVSFRLGLARVRKLLGAYLPGMSADAARLKEALGGPVNNAALETERLFALGWVSWLQGDLVAAERSLAEADRACQE